MYKDLLQHGKTIDEKYPSSMVNLCVKNKFHRKSLTSCIDLYSKMDIYIYSLCKNKQTLYITHY